MIAGREKDVLEGQARERQDRDQMETVKEELLGIYKVRIGAYHMFPRTLTRFFFTAVTLNKCLPSPNMMITVNAYLALTSSRAQSERARLTRKETDEKSPDSEEVIGENLRSTLRRKISEQAKVVSPPAQLEPASLLGAEPAALQEKPEVENRRNTLPQEAAGQSHALQNHREIQDTLSADLVSMAKQLKSNALAFSDHLGNDKSLLEQTQTQLDKAYTNVSTQQNRLGVYSAKAGGTTWLVLISLIVVFFSWTFLFVVIKLT